VAPTIISDSDYVSESDIELIALLTMAEAEGESEFGKRLVIDTILNRMDHSAWPDSVSGVIYQANQFSPMSDGRINKCYVSEYYCNLVREELESRTNYGVVYFRTTRYSDYGTPLFQEGNHYFSSY
jgi:N-acetylmuramoyl-L-alanine amidase